MRFDYYSATVETDPMTVLKTLSKLGDPTLTKRCDGLARAYRYDAGWEIIHPETGTACKILAAEGKRPFAFASSDATDAFTDAIREEWPTRHLVTRMDPCEDFYDESARLKIRRLMRSVAKERRMHYQVIRSPLDRTAGQTALLQRLAAVRGRLSLCADQAAAAKWWLSMPMASVSAEGPMPKALSTRRTSPLMPGCRHQGRACPLRRARMTSNPLIVA